jgi:NADH-quinone oxidoreductase chain G
MTIETKPAPPGTVTLTIDDNEVVVPKGTLLIEAARGAGIEIPYLCYHHKLTPFGGCRLCLVEVEKSPKMLAACNTPVADGMVVRTATDKVKSHRKGTMEFILLNHPLDCPVCDKGGECELQERTFQCADATSRMTEPKVHIADYDLGPLVYRNQDRCIICKRCIKVMEEVVGDPVLEFGQRGVTTEVYTFEHSAFQPGFSGNTIHVCPVGALLSKPFKFKARPWELIKTPSVCSLCSFGCNLREDTRENDLLRVVGLENPQINDGWLCDRGQFGYDYMNSRARLRAPLLRQDGRLHEVSWEDAIAFAAARLGDAQRMYGGKSVAFLGSERACNEDNFVFQQFARQVIESPHLDHRMGGGRGDYAALRPLPGAIETLGKADVVLVVASDLTAEVPLLDLVLKRGLLRGRMKLILIHPRATALVKFAHQWLRCAPGSEIAAANALVMAVLEADLADPAIVAERQTEVDAIRRGFGGATLAQLAAAAGLDEAAVRAAAATFAAGGQTGIVYGRAAAESLDGPSLVAALGNLSVLTGQGRRPGHVFLEAVEQCNSWGARDLGVLPDSGPGYSKVASGMGTPELLRALADGKLRAAVVMGANPVVDYPDAALAKRALDRAELLIVQDLFLTETAELADLVLPTLSVAEENGTLTNVEGRIQRTVRALDPRGGARADWQILSQIAAAMGKPLGYGTPAAVEREIRAALKAPRAGGPPGLTLQQVDAPPAPGPPADHSLRLLTGAVMFNRDTIQRHSTVLPGLAGEPYVELHPHTAEEAGLVADMLVVVEGANGGELTLALRVSEDTPPGAAFIPAGFNEQPVNRLLNDEGKPAWVTLRPAAAPGASDP